jgi:Protein of unknown function (DUF2510)
LLTAGRNLGVGRFLLDFRHYRGHTITTITTDTPIRLPAGWYSDPAQTGAKRWWDGTKWTEHLKLPEVTTPKAAPTHNDPYGLGQVRQTGPIAVTPAAPSAVLSPSAATDNRVAWISLLFGLIAVGLTLIPSLPGSTLWWVASAAVVSLVAAVIAIAGRVAGTSSNVVAPALGTILGAAATVMVVTGVGILGLVTGSLAPASAAAPASTANLALATSTEPLVFPANQRLTADGQVLQSVATAMNRTYAGGNPTLSAGQAWPASVKITSTSVVAADGTVIATIPVGHVLGYTRSADAKSYQITVADSNPTEAAVYESAANRFGFRCLPGDPKCVPTH